MTSRTLTATRPGPLTIDAHLLNHAGTITVRATPRCTRATLTVRTADTTGPASDAIRTATLRQDGTTLLVRVLNNSHVTRHHGRHVVNSASSGPLIQADTISGGIHFGGQATLTTNAPRQWSAPITIEATVPEHSSVTARTTTADIRIDGPVMDATCASDSGDIQVEQGLNTGARTETGAITLGHTTVVEASTVSGPITISHATGSHILTTDSGDITAHATGACGIGARTGGGDITITATSAAIAAGLTVHTNSRSGRVSVPRR